MIDKITQSLTNKIRKEMPDVDDERAEVINYGLQILLGEVPKTFIMLLLSTLMEEHYAITSAKKRRKELNL